MYSLDLRKKVLSLLEKGWGVSQVSRELSLSGTSLYRWLEQSKQGELNPKGWGPRRRKLDREEVLAYVCAHPDKTLSERSNVFHVHLSAMGHFFQRHKITWKKIFFYAERKEEERKVFLEELKTIPQAQCVYIDESGVDNRLIRTHACSAR